MFSVKKCKALARKTLLGKYTLAVGAQILAFIFPFVMALFCAGSLFFSAQGGGLFGGVHNDFMLIGGALLFSAFLMMTVLSAIFMRYGVIKLFINICRGESYGISNIWYPFRRGSHPFKVVMVEILRAIIELFFSLLVAAGIVIFFSFSTGYPLYIAVICAVIVILLIILYLNVSASLFLADLIIIDKPETGIFASLSRSFKLMKGHKLKAIWFMIFSFLFWYVLMSFCRWTLLWIFSYILCSRIFFYLLAEGTILETPSAKDPEVVYTETPPEVPHEENVNASRASNNYSAMDTLENANVAESDETHSAGESYENDGENTETQTIPAADTDAVMSHEPLDGGAETSSESLKPLNGGADAVDEVLKPWESYSAEHPQSQMPTDTGTKSSDGSLTLTARGDEADKEAPKPWDSYLGGNT